MRWFKGTLAVLLVFCIGQHALSEEKATLLQQFYVMKLFKPGLKEVGVILTSGTLEKMKDQLTRACLANGLKAVYAEVASPHELGEAMNTLVRNNNIGFLWLPPDDPLVSTEVAMKYLLKKAVLKGIATCVPEEKWLSCGGTIFVGVENGRVRPYFNTRLVEAMGMKVPPKYAEFATVEAQ